MGERSVGGVGWMSMAATEPGRHSPRRTSVPVHGDVTLYSTSHMKMFTLCNSEEATNTII